VRQHALDQGAQIVRGAGVTDLHHREDGVVVRAGERAWKASYVVAADGAHSTVRRLTGTEFPGKVLLNSITLAEPPATVITVDAVKDSFAFLAPFGDGWFRVIAWDRRHEAIRPSARNRRWCATSSGTPWAAYGRLRRVGRRRRVGAGGRCPRPVDRSRPGTEGRLMQVVVIRFVVREEWASRWLALVETPRVLMTTMPGNEWVDLALLPV
jgi:flavin-dependent dehydrogenase